MEYLLVMKIDIPKIGCPYLRRPWVVYEETCKKVIHITINFIVKNPLNLRVESRNSNDNFGPVFAMPA